MKNGEKKGKKKRLKKEGKKVKNSKVVGSQSQINSFPTFRSKLPHHLGHHQKHSPMDFCL